MQCDYFDDHRCRSCTWMGRPHAEQVDEVRHHVEDLLDQCPDLVWEAPYAGADAGFRNKAKMVVGGTLEAPTLGIRDVSGAGVDLRGCGLHEPALQEALPVLADFVSRAALTPYDVASRTGELKLVIATVSPDGELMVRWVLRSTEAEMRLRKHLPWLHTALPALRVVSLNVQPEHKAVLEGEREILLGGQATLPMRLPALAAEGASAGIVLHLRPQGFFQTNSTVASELYAAARDWVAPPAWAGEPLSRVWDLYCGVGGFALALAGPGRSVSGVELSAEAVQAARVSAAQAGLEGVDFVAGDATAYALGHATGGRAGHADPPPDLVVVNPPRRGIGPELAGWLEASQVRRVLYSSCHPASLATDLRAMPSLRPVRGRVFDMFPQTTHSEVLVLLER